MRSNGVHDYVASAPPWARKTLRDIRRAIISVAPGAKESISYRMPYYNQNGRLAYFAAFKVHCSFFWIGAKDKKQFAKELVKCKVVGSTLRIPKGTKVPVGLIKKLVRSRVKENTARKKR